MNIIMFPGQGAQFRGMGGDLWKDYPEITKEASEILGYCVRTLCTEDPEGKLSQTQFTQPALYVVNAMHYYRARELHVPADVLLGHSLGEYVALLAAGSFDFATGLRMVKKRGLLMSKAQGGAMAAVLGQPAETVLALLKEEGLSSVSLANHNSPLQSVIAGDKLSMVAAEKMFSSRGITCVMLNVSGAFHSPLMLEAQVLFGRYLETLTLNDPQIPVIANATALPYLPGQVATLLTQQLASPVLWVDSIRYLLAQGDFNYREMGATPDRPGSNVLSKLVEEIRQSPSASPRV